MTDFTGRFYLQTTSKRARRLRRAKPTWNSFRKNKWRLQKGNTNTLAELFTSTSCLSKQQPREPNSLGNEAEDDSSVLTLRKGPARRLGDIWRYLTCPIRPFSGLGWRNISWPQEFRRVFDEDRGLAGGYFYVLNDSSADLPSGPLVCTNPDIRPSLSSISSCDSSTRDLVVRFSMTASEIGLSSAGRFYANIAKLRPNFAPRRYVSDPRQRRRRSRLPNVCLKFLGRGDIQTSPQVRESELSPVEPLWLTDSRRIKPQSPRGLPLASTEWFVMPSRGRSRLPGPVICRQLTQSPDGLNVNDRWVSPRNLALQFSPTLPIPRPLSLDGRLVDGQLVSHKRRILPLSRDRPNQFAPYRAGCQLVSYQRRVLPPLRDPPNQFAPYRPLETITGSRPSSGGQKQSSTEVALSTGGRQDSIELPSSFDGPKLSSTHLGFPVPWNSVSFFVPPRQNDPLIGLLPPLRIRTPPSLTSNSVLTSQSTNPESNVQGTFLHGHVTRSKIHQARLRLFIAKQACEPWAERQGGANNIGHSGTALGCASSSLRYSSAKFKPQFSANPSSSNRNPLTARQSLKSLADLGSNPATAPRNSRPCCARSDLELKVADDLLHLSLLEYREPRSFSDDFPPFTLDPWSLVEVPEEEEEEEGEGEDISSPPQSQAQMMFRPRSRISCHLNERPVSKFLSDVHAQHQELINQPESPADSIGGPSWIEGDEANFTAFSRRRQRFVSSNLARAGFGPSAIFSRASFVERRNRHERFLNRDIEEWRLKLRAVNSLRKRLLQAEAAFRAVTR
jgi:hypothetical protein